MGSVRSVLAERKVLPLIAYVSHHLEIFFFVQCVYCFLRSLALGADVVNDVICGNKEVEDMIDVEIFAKTLMLASCLIEHVPRVSEMK